MSPVLADPVSNLAARVKPKLVADLLDVIFGRAFSYEQPLGNLAIAQAVGDEAGHLTLAPRE